MNIKKLEKFEISLYDVKDQLKEHVYRRSVDAFAIGDRARDELTCTEMLDTRRTYIRESFIERIGGLPSSDTPLNPRVTGTIECDGYRIENIIFESRPHTYVTSSLYIPEGTDKPRGTVLFVCGHLREGRLHSIYQTVCQYIVRAGLVVLAIDPIGQGERSSYFEPHLNGTTVDPATDDHEQAGVQCWPLGDGLARYFLHDIMRSIDYLCTRLEVDPDKIGITGNSGGGTQTSMAMFCDPRIAAAAPATFIMSRESYLFAGQAQDAEQIWQGMTSLGFDHEDILLAMAPRPVLVLAVKYDFFPIEGTRRTVERTKRFWEMYDLPDNINLFEDESTHHYTIPMAKAAAIFFAKHLLGMSITLEEVTIELQEFSHLWCTSTGQVRGDFGSARGVYEENSDRLNTIESARRNNSEDMRREKALFWLKQKVLGGHKRCDFNPRYVPLGRLNEINVQSCLWWSQEKVFNHALLFSDSRFAENRWPLTIAVWERGTRNLQPHLTWLRSTCAEGRAVMVLDVSGEGALMPNAINSLNLHERFGTIHKLTTDLMWLDDTLAAVRAYDVLRAIELAWQISNIDTGDIRLYTKGTTALYALLAKALDEEGKVSRLYIKDSVDSVAEWVLTRHYDPYDVMGTIMPSMLHYFDIPDLIRWTNAEMI